MSGWTSCLALMFILWCLLFRVPCWVPSGTEPRPPPPHPLSWTMVKREGACPLFMGTTSF